MNFTIRKYIERYLNNPKDTQELTDSCRDDINLKETTPHRRGIGMYVEFDNNTPFPIDFVKDFHRSSENKDKFYSYLVSFIYTSFVVI